MSGKEMPGKKITVSLNVAGKICLGPRLDGLDFAQKVRAQRMFLKMTQMELAAKMGVGRDTISSYERGLTEPRTLEMRRRLAEVLELKYEELYDVHSEAVPKARNGVSMGIDFGKLRRSLKKTNEFQLRCWKKMFKFVLEYAKAGLTRDDEVAIEGCLVEIGRIQKEHDAQDRQRRRREREKQKR